MSDKILKFFEFSKFSFPSKSFSLLFSWISNLFTLFISYTWPVSLFIFLFIGEALLNLLLLEYPIFEKYPFSALYLDFDLLGFEFDSFCNSYKLFEGFLSLFLEFFVDTRALLFRDGVFLVETDLGLFTEFFSKDFHLLR